MKIILRANFFLIFLLIGSFLLYADDFHVNTVYFVELKEQVQIKKVLMIDDALVILLPKNRIFFQGLEIEIRIPPEAIPSRNHIAYALYSDLNPIPAEGLTDFSGEQLFLETLPSRLSLILQVPFSSQKLKNSPYVQIIPADIKEKNQWMFFRLYSLIKEIPEGRDKIAFEVAVRPILKNNGMVNLYLRYPAEIEKPLNITINDVLVKRGDFPLLLPVGTHHLSIVSDHFRTEVRSFTVEQAKITTLDIALSDVSPRMTIAAPENTTIYLDGVLIPVDKSEIIIKPGEHTIQFVIGNYEITRTVFAALGKTYSVSLSIDAQITEMP